MNKNFWRSGEEGSREYNYLQSVFGLNYIHVN